MPDAGDLGEWSEKPLICRALLDVIRPANVLLRLGQLTRREPSIPPRRRAAREAVQTNTINDAGDVHVSLLERVTTRTMTVRWSDPQSGSYGEQLWRRSRSRCRSCCALSGLPIHPGDTVFRPACHGERVPFNRSRMILASQAELALGPLDAERAA
jgi:hypothetical protein